MWCFFTWSLIFVLVIWLIWEEGIECLWVCRTTKNRCTLVIFCIYLFFILVASTLIDHLLMTTMVIHILIINFWVYCCLRKLRMTTNLILIEKVLVVVFFFWGYHLFFVIKLLFYFFTIKLKIVLAIISSSNNLISGCFYWLALQSSTGSILCLYLIRKKGKSWNKHRKIKYIKGYLIAFWVYIISLLTIVMVKTYDYFLIEIQMMNVMGNPIRNSMKRLIFFLFKST